MRHLGVLDLPASRGNAGAPIVICPGWGEGLWGWRRAARQINEKTGRRVVVISAPGWRLRDIHQFFKPGKSLTRLALNVCEQMDRLGLVGAIGIGHSMAGVYMPLAATSNARGFTQQFLICPAGFIERDTFWRLALRLVNKAALSLVYAARHPRILIPTLVAVVEGLLYPLRNPFALRESIELPTVHAVPYRGTTIVLAKRDVIYPPHRVVVPEGTTVRSILGQHDPQYDAPGFADLIASLIAAEPAGERRRSMWLPPARVGGLPRFRGFGFVEFDEEDGEEPGTTVSEARPREERPHRSIQTRYPSSPPEG